MHPAEATPSGGDVDDQQVGAAARADDVRVAVARGPARSDVQGGDVGVVRGDRGDAGGGGGARHAAHAGAAVVELRRGGCCGGGALGGVCVQM